MTNSGTLTRPSWRLDFSMDDRRNGRNQISHAAILITQFPRLAGRDSPTVRDLAIYQGICACHLDSERVSNVSNNNHPNKSGTLPASATPNRQIVGERAHTRALDTMPTAASDSRLQWPRSDGDESRWPTDLVPGGKSWHEKAKP